MLQKYYIEFHISQSLHLPRPRDPALALDCAWLAPPELMLMDLLAEILNGALLLKPGPLLPKVGGLGPAGNPWGKLGPKFPWKGAEK